MNQHGRSNRFEWCGARGRIAALCLGLAAAASAGFAGPAAAQGDPPAVARAMEISEAFKKVALDARPSVARVTGYTAGGARVTGSGFVIDRSGHLLTNNHVVEPAASLLAEFSDGRIVPATLVGADPLTDLAVIRIAAEDTPPLPFADSSELEVGEWVVAVGFPLGLDQTVTVGVVSATNRRLNIVGSSIGRRGYEDFIQTDAAINRGNSGGPLLNLRGEVVGVNAAIVTQTGGSDGLGFAIPTRLASYIAGELISKGRVVRAWLGIGLQELTPALAESYGLDRTQHGVLLTQVNLDAPAGRAGLLVEDILISIDDRPVLSVEDLRNQIAMMEPGKRILVEIHRKGRLRRVEVVLVEMPDADPSRRRVIEPPRGGRVGLTLEDLRPGEVPAVDERSAVLVSHVVPGKPAQLSGLSQGDLIVEVNGEPLRAMRVGYDGRSHAMWLYETIERSPPGTILRFTLLRHFTDAAGRIAGRDRQFVAVELP